MKIESALITRNPTKNYGKDGWDEIAGALLATDYKSPPLCMILYEDCSD